MNWQAVGSAGALVSALLFSSSAAAIPIQIASGGFTSFSGESAGTSGLPPGNTVSPGCSPGFVGFVAGTVVQAVSCAFAGISGAASLTFSSLLSSVDFHESAFGLGPNNGFGDAPHNEIKFERNVGTQEVSDPTKQQFLLGKLTFTNGTWFGTGKVNRFHLEITATSSDSSFGTQILSDDLVLDIRTGSTAEANGDCISFNTLHAVPLPSLCAYEPNEPGKTNTTSALLWGVKGSLIPTAFTDVTGGFLVGAAATIPEPTPLGLLGLGLAGLAAIRRKPA